ncbi:hypothetical protein HY612_04710 [Candidatus Roizmanbacteria bacterium]|nr:hypothetical protein [Candidatus Roizmanbacteria bacterium]
MENEISNLNLLDHLRFENPFMRDIRPGEGPIIFDNRRILTALGPIDIEVNRVALRNFLIEHAGSSQSALPNIDQGQSETGPIDRLVIAFGIRGFRKILTLALTAKFYNTDQNPTEALKRARKFATAVNLYHRVIRFGAPVYGAFFASEECPFIYLDVPSLVSDHIESGGEKGDLGYKLTQDLGHELGHYLDNLEPEKVRPYKADNLKTYLLVPCGTLGALWCSGEIIFLNSIGKIEDPSSKILTFLAGQLAISFLALTGGLAASSFFYKFFSISEQRARKSVQGEQLIQLKDIIRPIFRND